MNATALDAARAREVKAIIAHDKALGAWGKAEREQSVAVKACQAARKAKDHAFSRLHVARCRVADIVLGKGPPPLPVEPAPALQPLDVEERERLAYLTSEQRINKLANHAMAVPKLRELIALQDRAGIS